MACGAERAFGARRVIAAGIGHDPRSQREQAPFGIGADRERDRHRMALHVVLRRLLAGEHGLDGPLQKVRGNRRLSLNRQLLFRAERAAACRQNDLDVSGIQVEDLRNLRVVVHRSLALSVDSDPVALRHRQARFRFEKGDVDRLRLKRRFDDMRGRGERRTGVSARERGDRLEHIGGSRRKDIRRVHQQCAGLQRVERIGDRFEHLVIDLHVRGGLTRVELRVGHDHRDEVGDAARHLPFRHEQGLVRIVESGRTRSRNVDGREHSHDAGYRRCIVGVNLQDSRARMLGEYHRAVQHPRHLYVLDERRLAKRLREAVQTRHGVANAVILALAAI